MGALCCGTFEEVGCPKPWKTHGKLGRGWTTRLKNMLLKLDDFPKKGQKSINNNLWDNHLEKNIFALSHVTKYSNHSYSKWQGRNQRHTTFDMFVAPQHHPPHHCPTSSRYCRFEGLVSRPTSRVHRTAFPIAATSLLRFFEREVWTTKPLWSSLLLLLLVLVKTNMNIRNHGANSKNDNRYLSAYNKWWWRW